MKKMWVDLEGTKFGRLTVVKLAFSHKATGNFWYCSCACTGSIVDRPYRAGELNNKTIMNCGCIKKPRPELERYKKYDPNFLYNKIFRSYKNNAAKRKLYFSLTFTHFKNLVDSSCHYCGRTGVDLAKDAKGNLRYNGIDRVENSLGYALGNVVPCCGPCNRLKMNTSYEDFLGLVIMIYNNINRLS